MDCGGHCPHVTPTQQQSQTTGNSGQTIRVQTDGDFPEVIDHPLTRRKRKLPMSLNLLKALRIP